jgi:hypothetical protein
VQSVISADRFFFRRVERPRAARPSNWESEVAQIDGHG